MPIVRKSLAQSDAQALRVDHPQRVVNCDPIRWQPLYDPRASFEAGRILKVAAEFDSNTFDDTKIVAYLYNKTTRKADKASSCSFSIYSVASPDWTENLLTTAVGSEQSNNYWYIQLDNMLIDPPASIDGDTTLMIEATVERLGETYRDRIYVNHLGVYASLVQLRKKVTFLSITKADI